MRKEIKTNVIAYIGSFANMKPEDISEEYILRSNPLHLDNIKLGFLTIALRAYLKSLNPDATLYVTEIRKSGMTVKKTYELIIQKSGL